MLPFDHLLDIMVPESERPLLIERENIMKIQQVSFSVPALSASALIANQTAAFLSAGKAVKNLPSRKAKVLNPAK